MTSFRTLLLGAILCLTLVWGCDVELVRFPKEGGNTETVSETNDSGSLENDAPEQKEPTPSEAGPEPQPESLPDLPTLGLRKLHQPCNPSATAPIAEKCARGFVCHPLNSQDAFCLQDCGQDSSICSRTPDGRTECRQVGWAQGSEPKAIKACIKPVDEGGICDLSRSKACIQNGEKYLVCVVDKCVKGKIVTGVGLGCGKDRNPPSECALSLQLTCTSDNSCKKGFTAFEGSLCNKSTQLCEEGTVCSGFPGEQQACYRKCAPGLKCPGQPQHQCLSFDGVADICVQANCVTYKDCEFGRPAYDCLRALDDGTRLCLPALNGTQTLGQYCDPTERKDCKHGLDCNLYSSNPKLSACTPRCRFLEDCTTIDPKLGCDKGNGLCVYPCKSTADCPKGLQCSGIGACAAPRP